MAKNSRKQDGRPSIQWYPADWLEEPGLKLCSLAAKGLWMDLLCYMFKMENRGFLCINGLNLGSKEVAELVGKPEAEVKQALSELDRYGVSETTDEGCIYSRRMVSDEKQRQSKVEAGRRGGRVSRPLSKTQAKGGSSSPTPSSSSSSSTPISTPSPKRKSVHKSDGRASLRFDKFWKAYPKKQAKISAKTTFLKLDPDNELLEKMLDAVERGKASYDWHEENGKYIPLPATWLNAGRWDDEYTPAPSTGRPQAPPGKYANVQRDEFGRPC